MNTELPNVVTTVVGSLMGAVGIPVTNWLKTKLKWFGWKARLLSVGVSFGLAVVSVFVTGFLTPVDFSGENLFLAIASVVSVTQYGYGFLKDAGLDLSGDPK